MSEFEIQRRQEYKKNRKKWTIIQIIIIAVVVAIALSSALIYYRMNRTYYIEYAENSAVDYKVHYAENDFYQEEWLGKDQEYIASLIQNMTADFAYTLNMDANNVGFDYTYLIDAKLLIADKDSGNTYYSTTEELIARKSGSAIRTNSISVNESVTVDYIKFNDIAKTFVETYNLENATCTLIVSLKVDVLSSCNEFESGCSNSYFTSLSIPLCEDTFSISITSSVPETESRVLAYSGAVNQNLFLTVAIVAATVALILLVLLFIFLQITRNEDITYIARVRKIISAYRSYIQQMEGEFDASGYQLISIKSFREMLEIRDTIQSPILMTENQDETKTSFLIPTATKILYVFEIKVENYDLIYGTEDSQETAIILSEDVNVDEITEAMSQPDVILSEIEYEQDHDSEFEVAADEPGVEVVGVVWPERAHKNKVYRYDPNGEVLEDGDMVLVPTRDAAKNREVIRKAAVAHGNHRIDSEHVKHPLKKIIGVIKRKTEAALTPNNNTPEE